MFIAVFFLNQVVRQKIKEDFMRRVRITCKDNMEFVDFEAEVVDDTERDRNNNRLPEKTD